MSKLSNSKRVCPGNRKKITSPMSYRTMSAKVCEAVVRALEKWTGETRADVRHPDKEGSDPSVDMRLKLGAKSMQSSTQRIESYQNQIGTDVVVDRIIRHIKKNIPHPFPSPSYYELQFPIRRFLSQGKGQERPGPEGHCRMGSHKGTNPA